MYCTIFICEASSNTVFSSRKRTKKARVDLHVQKNNLRRVHQNCRLPIAFLCIRHIAIARHHELNLEYILKLALFRCQEDEGAIFEIVGFQVEM